eukprot:UN03998
MMSLTPNINNLNQIHINTSLKQYLSSPLLPQQILLPPLDQNETYTNNLPDDYDNTDDSDDYDNTDNNDHFVYSQPPQPKRVRYEDKNISISIPISYTNTTIVIRIGNTITATVTTIEE